MAEDNYGPIEQSAPAKTEDKPAEDDGAQSALIPKTLFAGKDFKVGDEIVLKIVHLYEDEAEVEYASQPKEDKPKSTMDEAEGGLERMAKPPMEG